MDCPVWVFALASAVFISGSVAAADRPHVLLIHADQVRIDALGAYGNAQIKTPAIDQLAADGLRFKNSFCSFPVCTPSRYSLLSGLPVHEHRGWNNHCTLPPGTPTFASLLREAGYATKAVGKMHFTPAYLEIPATYLVPAGSAIRSISEVDREGVRIAVSARSAYDLYLSRTLKHAKLERAEGIDASHELFLRKNLEVLAGLKPRLVADAEKLPGSRVLEGQVTGVQQAVGVPRNRENAARFTREFVEDIKKSGLVAKTIEKHGVKGVTVAP
jgi:hypothetical protein